MKASEGRTPLKEPTLRPRFWNHGHTHTQSRRSTLTKQSRAEASPKPQRTSLTSSQSLYSRLLMRSQRHFISPSLTINTFVGLSQGTGGEVWDELWRRLNTSLTGRLHSMPIPCLPQPATVGAFDSTLCAHSQFVFLNCHVVHHVLVYGCEQVLHVIKWHLWFICLPLRSFKCQQWFKGISCFVFFLTKTQHKHTGCGLKAFYCSSRLRTKKVACQNLLSRRRDRATRCFLGTLLNHNSSEYFYHYVHATSTSKRTWKRWYNQSKVRLCFLCH